MKIKSGIFLLSIGLCITVGNMAQAAGRTTATREGIAFALGTGPGGESIFVPLGEGEHQLISTETVQCPKNGFLVARADTLFQFHAPAKLPGLAFVDLRITRGDETFETVDFPRRGISLPFSNPSEFQFFFPGSIQRVDRCREGDKFSYVFRGVVGGTGDEDGIIVTSIGPILVVEFFEKSIEVE
jgi:hypothetical protein